MKLRTVLSELQVSDYVTGEDVNLDSEVIVFPSDRLENSFRELLTLAPQGRRSSPADFLGMTLAYCGAGPLDYADRPVARTVYVASDSSYEEFWAAFSRLPALHVHLDLQRKRLYQAFQSSYDIQRYADRVYEVLGNPLMIVNSDRRLLASAGDFPEDRADVLEEINQG